MIALAAHAFPEARVDRGVPLAATTHLAQTSKHYSQTHAVDDAGVDEVVVVPLSAAGDGQCATSWSVLCRRGDVHPSPPPVSRLVGSSGRRGVLGSFDGHETVPPPAFDNPGLRSGCQQVSRLRQCSVSLARSGRVPTTSPC